MGDFRSYDEIEKAIKGDLFEPKNHYDVSSHSLTSIKEYHQTLNTDVPLFLGELKLQNDNLQVHLDKISAILATLTRRINICESRVESLEKVVEIRESTIKSRLVVVPDKIFILFELRTSYDYKIVREYLIDDNLEHEKDIIKKLKLELVDEYKGKPSNNDIKFILPYLRAKFLIEYWNYKKETLTKIKVNFNDASSFLENKMTANIQTPIQKNDFALLLYLCYRLDGKNPLIDNNRGHFKDLLFFHIQGKDRIKPKCDISDILEKFSPIGKYGNNANCSGLLSDSKLFDLYETSKKSGFDKRLKRIEKYISKLENEDLYLEETAKIKKDDRRYFNPKLPVVSK